MKSEVKIILEEGASNKAKGNCFENLIRKLLSIHQYEIRGNINFSGMEIDLIAHHKHINETLYVECKAKEKVSSDELTKFGFNVGFKEVDKGYFFRTHELESQAGALLAEIKSKPKYSKLSFFEPGDIIKMLLDARLVYEPTSDLNQHIISKRILAVTFYGDFFIYLINESNALPTKFIVINAGHNEKLISQEHVDKLQSQIEEIKNLEFFSKHSQQPKKDQATSPEIILDTISEVQESENWYDYLPASSDKNHFVGRDNIRTQILRVCWDFHAEAENEQILLQARQILQPDAGNPAKNLTPYEGKFAIWRPVMKFPTYS